MNLASSKRQWPLGRGFERYYGFLGGETNQWYPDLVYDNHPVAAAERRRRRATTSRSTSPTRRSSSSRTPRRSRPTSRSSSTTAPAPRTRRTTRRRSGPTSTQGTFDMGYEAYRELVFERQKQLGIIPDGAELSPINPYADTTSHDGKPWSELDRVRPWDSLSDDEQRLFARMAEVYAGLPQPRRPRARAAARLPRGRPGSSTTRSSCSSPTTAPPARAARTARSTRTSSSTASRTRSRRTSSTSTSSAARRPTTTTRPAGPGRSTRRSRCGSATPTTRAAPPTR